MHSIKEIDMLAVKMDLLTKQVEHYEKVSAQETLKAMDSHMTCKYGWISSQLGSLWLGSL
jgi:hypothetical protein